MKDMSRMMNEEMEMTPLDDIISRVKEYKMNPKMITPDTMQELLDDLMDLKGYVDKEDSEEYGGTEKKHGLSIIIGGMKGEKE